MLTLTGIKSAQPNLSRNEIFRLRYAKGESLSDRANGFGISPQRVYQCVGSITKGGKENSGRAHTA